jgi:NADH-quinone oxidoreductase subunit M
MTIMPSFSPFPILSRPLRGRVALPSPIVLVVAVLLGAGSARAVADEAQDGTAPALELAPRALTFARAGETAVVTVRNRGVEPADVVAVRIASLGDSDFLTNAVGRRTLGPGEAVGFDVTYRPGLGARRQSFAALEVEYRPADTGQRSVTTVALRGGEALGLLSWLIFAPLLGLPLLFLWPRGRERGLRWLALAVTAVPLGLAARLVAEFDAGFTRAQGNFGYQFVQHIAWIRAFNVEYHVGVDGLSVGLVALTALISVIAVLASWSIPVERNLRGYFALLLLLETGMLGVFVALDLFLFYVFWEMVLVPMFFLIGLWGGPRREYAALKFFLYTLLGSVLILLAVIALYYASAPTFLVDGTPAAHTLDIPKLVHANDFGKHPALLGLRFANLVWVLLFIGFAIKVPVVPLHTWLPDAHVEAPTAVSVILASVLLKMGTYGMLRVGWAILPEATRWASPAVAALGALSVVYGAFAALGQADLKRLVAYSSISHLGYCLLGMAALTPIALGGAVYQMLSHGVVSAMLFLLVGVLYERTKERGLDAFGGVASVMPRYAVVFALAFLASLGLPGLSGFIGELMTLLGAMGRFRGATVAAALGLVIGAAYNLSAIRRIQFGTLPERWKAALTGHDLTAREWACLLPLAVLTLVMGLYPAPILDAARSGVTELLTMMGLPSTGLGGGL